MTSGQFRALLEALAQQYNDDGQASVAKSLNYFSKLFDGPADEKLSVVLKRLKSARVRAGLAAK